MKKRKKLKKKALYAISAFIILVLGLSIFGVKKYKHYKYTKTYE